MLIYIFILHSFFNFKSLTDLTIFNIFNMKFTLALFIASTAIISAAPVPRGNIERRAIDLGTCADASVTFAVGLDGRKGTILSTQRKVNVH